MICWPCLGVISLKRVLESKKHIVCMDSCYIYYTLITYSPSIGPTVTSAQSRRRHIQESFAVVCLLIATVLTCQNGAQGSLRATAKTAQAFSCSRKQIGIKPSGTLCRPPLAAAWASEEPRQGRSLHRRARRALKVTKHVKGSLVNRTFGHSDKARLAKGLAVCNSRRNRRICGPRLCGLSALLAFWPGCTRIQPTHVQNRFKALCLIEDPVWNLLQPVCRILLKWIWYYYISECFHSMDWCYSSKKHWWQCFDSNTEVIIASCASSFVRDPLSKQTCMQSLLSPWAVVAPWKFYLCLCNLQCHLPPSGN